jgi:hypothetical protein
MVTRLFRGWIRLHRHRINPVRYLTRRQQLVRLSAKAPPFGTGLQGNK